MPALKRERKFKPFYTAWVTSLDILEQSRKVYLRRLSSLDSNYTIQEAADLLNQEDFPACSHTEGIWRRAVKYAVDLNPGSTVLTTPNVATIKVRIHLNDSTWTRLARISGTTAPDGVFIHTLIAKDIEENHQRPLTSKDVIRRGKSGNRTAYDLVLPRSLYVQIRNRMGLFTFSDYVNTLVSNALMSLPPDVPVKPQVVESVPRDVELQSTQETEQMSVLRVQTSAIASALNITPSDAVNLAVATFYRSLNLEK